MKDQILDHLKKSLVTLDIESQSVNLDYPENTDNGDFATNVAMVHAKQFQTSPRELAEKIVMELQKGMPEFIRSVNVAGAGFINFFVKDEEFAREAIGAVLQNQTSPQPSPQTRRGGTQVLIEHTDPNTFKPFHIGHLMANAIGESLSRLISFSGDQVTRICYPSDIGLHIAKSIWAIGKNEEKVPKDNAPIIERTAFLGQMYAEGTAAYEKDEKAKSEIDILNKAIYDKTDSLANFWYEKGKKWSLEHFDLLYKRLGTEFDEYIYESEVAPIGLAIVNQNTGKIFEESEGAVVFKGEKYGLHTRVFVNSQGLATYEAKELGLNTSKFQKYPKTDLSVVVTANEQNDYFKVLIKALSLVDSNIGSKTVHIGHGMLRLESGKMSSRTGKVITAESLIDEIKNMVIEKMAEGKTDTKDLKPEERDEIADMIAIAAIKYTILRQAIGGDIIFDSAKSISFEGDSGPYLQYSAVRAAAVLEKAAREGIEVGEGFVLPEKVSLLEKLIVRFTDIASRARNEYAPQIVANYLTTLAGEFNSFYARQIIVDKKDPLSPYYVALTKAFLGTITKGLWLLGIKVPKKM